jgi:phage terminase Nu1 subunit (DNA packaging protein)
MMVLNGWKQIAQYLGRGVRTVQRWELRGLPVRRPNMHLRTGVVALSSDIDDWVRALPSRIEADLRESTKTGAYERRAA